MFINTALQKKRNVSKVSIALHEIYIYGLKSLRLSAKCKLKVSIALHWNIEWYGVKLNIIRISFNHLKVRY